MKKKEGMRRRKVERERVSRGRKMVSDDGRENRRELRE